jgi:hypothetical protein
MKSNYSFLSRYKKLPVYANGSIIPYAQIGQIAGNAIESNNKDVNVGGDPNFSYQSSKELGTSYALKYAGQGAALGTALAPVTGGISIAVGAALGAGYGAYKGVKEGNENKENMNNSFNRYLGQKRTQGLDNYSSMLSQGFNPKGNYYQSKTFFADGGVVPKADKKLPFNEFLRGVDKNYVSNDYDLESAYNELPYNTLLNWKTNPKKNHLPDTYKLPNHPTFSVESKYYKQGMKAGYWDKDTFIKLDGTNNPIKFNRGGTILKRYAEGGFTPQYEVEKDEIVEGEDVQLSNGKSLTKDLHKATDYTHEDYNANTGTTGVLGSGGNRVFSNRSKLSNEAISILSMFKLKVNTNTTHAKAMEEIAKKEIKVAKLDGSTNFRTQNTADALMSRYKGMREVVFNDQEIQKEPLPQFKMGGTIKKKLPRYYKGASFEPVSIKFPETAPKIYPKIDPIGGVQNFNPYNFSGNNYNESEFVTTPTVDNISIRKDYAKTGNSAIDTNPTAPVNNMQNLSDYSGTIANTLGLIANTQQVNKLKTSFKPKFVSAPNRYYYSAAPLAMYNNSVAARNTMTALNRYSPNSSNIFGTLGSQLEANNQIAVNENNNRNQFNNQVAEDRYKTNAVNTELENQSEMLKFDNENQKIALKNAAMQSYVQGEMQNKTYRDQAKLGREQLEIMKRNYSDVSEYVDYSKMDKDLLENLYKTETNPRTKNRIKKELEYRGKS